MKVRACYTETELYSYANVDIRDGVEHVISGEASRKDLSNRLVFFRFNQLVRHHLGISVSSNGQNIDSA